MNIAGLLLYAVLLFHLMAPAEVLAQQYKGYDTKLPVEITSDQLDILQTNKLAVFRGNVIAQQGTVKLRAESMTVHYRPAKGREEGSAAVSRIDVDGKVFMATPQESAQANKGVYDVDKKMIYLMGNVILTRGNNALKGSNLQYNLATGRSVITGGKEKQGKKGERVRGVFVPIDKK